MAKVTQKGAAKARIPTLISLTPKPKFFLPVTQASGFPGPPGPSNTISSANGVTGRAPSVTDTAAKSSCYTGIIAQMGMCGHLCISDTTLPTPTTLFFKIPSNPKLLTTHEPQKKTPCHNKNQEKPPSCLFTNSIFQRPRFAFICSSVIYARVPNNQVQSCSKDPGQVHSPSKTSATTHYPVSSHQPQAHCTCSLANLNAI